MAESFTNEKKTLWGNGEIAHCEQFLLFHCVFKGLILQTRKNQGLYEKGLKPSNSILSFILLPTKTKNLETEAMF